MMIDPPSPPSPPSGPPLGTYFSRRKLLMPRPPSPAFTKTSTRSTNTMHLLDVTRKLHAGDLLAPEADDQPVLQRHHRLRIGQLGPVRADAHGPLGHLLPGLVIALAEPDGHEQPQQAHLIRSRVGRNEHFGDVVRVLLVGEPIDPSLLCGRSFFRPVVEGDNITGQRLLGLHRVRPRRHFTL